MSASEKDLIVGGQAVIEGVMMRTPSAYAVAVRRPDGTITHTGARLPKWGENYPALKLPVLRGAAVLIQSMALGIKALNYSAAEAFNEEAETAEAVALTPAVVEGEGDFAGLTGGVPGLFPVPTKKNPEDELKRGSAAAFGSIAFALLFNVLLFVVAPLVLTNALFIGMGWADRQATDTAAATQAQTATTGAQTTAATQAGAVANTAQSNDAPWYSRAYNGARGYLKPVKPNVAFNLIDGLIRMAIFITMIASFSLSKDIRRVFEYHGAEHKTVFNWEAGLPLSVENARVQPRQHPRCGTSFLMVVMLVSIVLFSVVAFSSFAYNIAVRVALIPVVAGLSYEIIRLSAKKEGGLVFKFITRPGVWLQNLTTKEPDDKQLEVAIVALKESLKLEPQPGEAALTPLS